MLDSRFRLLTFREPEEERAGGGAAQRGRGVSSERGVGCRDGRWRGAGGNLLPLFKRIYF